MNTLKSNENNEILFKALQSGKYKDIKKALPLADINYVSPIGLTFLHLACSLNKENVVDLILNDSRLDLTSCLEPKKLPSPIHIATEFKNQTIIDKLIKKDLRFLNAENNSGQTILHKAVEQNNISLIKYLLSYGEIDINHQDKNGTTPIHINFMKKPFYEEMAQLLIKHGANINEPFLGDSQNSILIYTIGDGENKLATEFLLKQKIDLNYKNNYGLNALHTACIYNKIEIAKALIEKGIDLHAKSQKEKLAYELAPKDKREELIIFIEKFQLENNINQKESTNKKLKI